MRKAVLTIVLLINHNILIDALNDVQLYFILCFISTMAIVVKVFIVNEMIK